MYIILQSYVVTNDCLVGGFNPSEKYVAWDDSSQYMETLKKKKQSTNHQPEYANTVVSICASFFIDRTARAHEQRLVVVGIWIRQGAISVWVVLSNFACDQIAGCGPRMFKVYTL